MRAFQVTTIGQDPILQVIDVPPLMPDTLQVQVKFCGLNFADILMIKGTYQDTPEPPFTWLRARRYNYKSGTRRFVFHCWAKRCYL